MLFFFFFYLGDTPGERKETYIENGEHKQGAFRSRLHLSQWLGTAILNLPPAHCRIEEMSDDMDAKRQGSHTE